MIKSLQCEQNVKVKKKKIIISKYYILMIFLFSKRNHCMLNLIPIKQTLSIVNSLKSLFLKTKLATRIA